MDGESDKDTLYGSYDDIRYLVNWQQNQHHHIKNLSLALLGGVLTLLAILVSIWVNTSKVISVPIPILVDVRAVARDSIFSWIGVSFFFAFNYLLCLSLICLAIVAILYSLYKWYDIAASPPLKPRLWKNDIVVLEDMSVLNHDQMDIPTFQNHLNVSVVSNQNIIRTSWRDFKMALIRVPASIVIGFTAIQILNELSTVDLWDLILFNASLVIPSSISAIVLNGLFSPSEDEGGYTSLGQALLQEDGGRFPNQFTRLEKVFAVGTTIFLFTSVAILILDLCASLLL
ncbi:MULTISPECIES: hypothetical protein [Halorussus]|uniref:hypothetical protein n=1 Tax=Halorussus TaxID=1070314 RepID=UPI0013B3E73F|nr:MULTISPECIES: hypothetical protein [Halorussus]NHN58317.1 hypothetical protein [Halorussus sp. JP-T4]